MNDYEALARHESGHLAMAAVTGRRPYYAQLGGLPHPELGVVWYADLGKTPEDVRAHAMVSLAGPIGEGDPNWPLRWPLNPYSRGDEKAIEHYVTALAKYEQRDPKRVYEEIVAETLRKASQRIYVLLEDAFATALMIRPVLKSNDIARLCRIVLEVLEVRTPTRTGAITP